MSKGQIFVHDYLEVLGYVCRQLRSVGEGVCSGCIHSTPFALRPYCIASTMHYWGLFARNLGHFSPNLATFLNLNNPQ